MVGHINLERIHGKDVYIVRFFDNMHDLCVPTKRSVDMYECSEVVCSKEALEEFNEVAEMESLWEEEYSMEKYDKIVQKINNHTKWLNERASNG